MSETKKQKEARLKRAQSQIETIGYASLKNRKSPEEIERAMVLSNGNLKVLCKILDCTYLEWMSLASASKEIGKRWKEVRKCIASEAESVMLQLLESQDEEMRFKTSKYLLDSLGASEGYGSKPQVAVSVEQANEDKVLQIKAIFGINE